MRKRKMYLSVEDIAELFGLSVSFAYRVVERMNADLESKNYYVILGRVPTRYVEDKIYGLEHVEQYLKEDKEPVSEIDKKYQKLLETLSPEQEEVITEYCNVIFSSGADTEEFFYRLGLKDGLNLKNTVKSVLEMIS